MEQQRQKLEQKVKKMQFKSEKNGMRRMVYASILKRLVFFGFVAEEDSAISQYHECIIRILLLCVMNLANRHVALCASFSTFYTTVVYGMHGKRAAIIQQKCCNTRKKNESRAKLKLIWKQSVHMYAQIYGSHKDPTIFQLIGWLLEIAICVCALARALR